MSESSKHLELVERLLSYINERYGNRLAVLHDLPGRIGCDKPPIIGSFRPDVYAVDAPPTITIIGEAKVQQDLETRHTREQFLAFLEFLRFQHNSEFVLAVPWQAKARGRTVIGAIANEVAATRVKIAVIDEMPTKP